MGMKVEKLFTSAGYGFHYVVKRDGKYYKFWITPFREIQDKDLTHLPYYREMGKRALEAPRYMYKCYGLEKEEVKQ